MRRLFILLCFVGLIFLISACGNEEKNATKVGEEFIEKLYKVDDTRVDLDQMSPEQLIEYQNSFSSYFTEKEFKNLEAKRFFLIPQEISSSLNNNISLENITIKESNKNQNFEHNFTLIFTDQDGNKTEEIEMKGQMTIVDTENGFKIDRYYDGAEKILINK